MSRAAFLAAAAGAARSGLAQQGQIKPAVLITMLPKELSYLDRFKLAIDVGFHYMEVQTFDDDDEAHKVKEAADKAGLRIHSVMNMRHWEYPLSSPDPKDVEMSLEGMRTSLRQAKLYGADTVLLVPAVVREDTTYEQAWERSQQQVRKLIPDAEKANVIIALEEVWNKFLLTPRDFVQYVDEFKHPARQSVLRRRQCGALWGSAAMDPGLGQADCQSTFEGLFAAERVRELGRRRHQLAGSAQGFR